VTAARPHASEIRLFLVLLLVMSGGFYAFLFLEPGAPGRWPSYSAAFMWCPGLAAVLTLLILRRSLRGLGWSRGGLRCYLIAYALPVAFCVPVYLVVWWSGLGGFDAAAFEAYRSRTGLPAGLAGSLGVIAAVLLSAPLGVIATLGEELGWRGFLVPRLFASTNFTRTSVITGLVWSAWHYPVVVAVLPVFIPKLPIAYAIACFTVSVVAISFVYTWLRLRSGSVFPPALLHATSNAFMGAFESLTKHNEVTSYYTYEYGLGFALVVPLLSLPFWKAGQRLPRAPFASATAGVTY
jgi:membrane protease YdiL (CAAX protease family)